MCKMILLAALILFPAQLLISPVSAQSIKCGAQSLPPLGCKYDSGRCVCDQNGNCQWVYDCN
jgi:hypothetical protein